MRPLLRIGGDGPSLAVRFILFTSLLVLVTALSVSTFFLVRYESRQDGQMRRKGISLVRSLAHNAELGVLTRNAASLTKLAGGLFQDDDVIGVSIVDTEGVVLLEHRRGIATQRLVATSIPVMEGGPIRIGGFAMEGTDTVVAYEATMPVFTERAARRDEEIEFMEEGVTARVESDMIGYARVTLSLDAMTEDLAALKRAFGGLTSVVIFVGIFVTVTLVKRMVAPLQDLAEATRRIAEGRLDETVEEGHPGEIGRLARAFNRMIADLRRGRRALESHSAELEKQVRARTRELENAQHQLVQAEKMSALGLLVSGVAHELNNPLAGVVGYSQLLLRGGADESVRKGLEKINREAERCKKIVQNLQTFARKRKPQKELVGVNGVLESTLELRAYQLKVDNINVETDLDPDLPMIQADFHQLQQVFLNIIINAHQAMMGTGRPGRLLVRTRHVQGTAMVEIEDNGPGILQEDLGRVFDPFFTTKEVGQGTGLGLSICYGIIEEHQGRISSHNAADGGGAVFRVELPIAENETVPGVGADIGHHAPVETEERGAARCNILVVDDEPAILDILRQVLRVDGHRVDTALNGAVALRKISNEHYDVIISDLKMPGMSGQELFGVIRGEHPELAARVIFSTGDVVSDDTRGFLESSGNRYLQKPFEIDSIRRTVYSLLQECGRAVPPADRMLD